MSMTHEILRTYTTNLAVINTSSKVEHCWSSRGYNVPKALCIRGRCHKVIEYEGHCQTKSNKVLMVHKGSDVSIGTQPEEESMQRPWIIETTSNLELNCKGIMIYKAKDQKQTL